MRALLITATAFSLVAATGSAFAQGRPNSLAMSCSQARATVESSGAIVLGSGPSIYDRFVNSRSFCTPSEITDPGFVATADNPQCFVGYRCVERTQRGQDVR